MNTKINEYILPIITVSVVIILSLIGLQYYMHPVQEGLETDILTEDGVVVRRKKKVVQEGLKDPLEGIKKTIKKIENIFKFIPNFFKYLFNYFISIQNNIKKVFIYVGDVFKWLGLYLAAGMKFIVNFPDCFKWYSLEIVGNILYTPIKCVVWLFEMKNTEKNIWKNLEKMDCTVKKFIGFNIIHYSPSIQMKCYTFCPPDFPRFPKMDWRFNPPTLKL